MGGGSGFQHMNFEVGTNIHSITATIYDFVYGKSEMLTQTKIAIRWHEIDKPRTAWEILLLKKMGFDLEGRMEKNYN